MNCRICKADSHLFFKDNRTFYKCPDCTLIFTEEMAGGDEAEKHYKGQWDNSDPNFWKQQVDVLLQVIEKYVVPEKILDFGSGSGDITKELKQRGYDATPLEPMEHGFLKDQNYSDKFNAIIGVEVIEHIPNMWEELHELEKVLTGDGVMLFSTILTNPFIDSPNAAEVFKGWWYKDDQTHVSFFSNRSIAKLAELGNYSGDVYGNQLFVLRKKA